MLMDVNQLLSLSVRLAAPILMIAIGGLFSLRVSIFNIALEGLMLMGCFGSVIGAYYFHDPIWGIVIGVLFSVIITSIYSILVLEYDVNPIICALATITVCSGLTAYLLTPIFHSSGRYILPSSLAIPTIHMVFLEKIPYIGPMLNNHSVLVYFSFILPFVIQILLYKTNFGLSMRAVGSNAEAAAADGINVKRVRYIALAVTGVMCGLGGAELALSINMFNIDMSGGRGWIALAVIILTASEPIPTFFACLMFGVSQAIVLIFSGEGYPVQILSMLPYFLALVVAIVPQTIRIIRKKVRWSETKRRISNQQPASS
jgi:general nucleoside transport system permease protein